MTFIVLYTIGFIYVLLGISISYEEFQKHGDELNGLKWFILYYIIIPTLWLPYFMYRKFVRMRIEYRRRNALIKQKFIKNY